VIVYHLKHDDKSVIRLGLSGDERAALNEVLNLGTLTELSAADAELAIAPAGSLPRRTYPRNSQSIDARVLLRSVSKTRS